MIKEKIIGLSLIMLSSLAISSTCSFDLKSDDKMTFNVKEIVVPSTCKDFTINLSHTGKMAKKAMGHNVVISKTSDMKAIIKDGIKAGAKSDYIKANDKRVIAHSDMIGGSEKSTVTFSKDAVADGAGFFCSFPGHFGTMQGKIVVK